jgi:hypothetical protein
MPRQAGRNRELIRMALIGYEAQVGKIRGYRGDSGETRESRSRRSNSNDRCGNSSKAHHECCWPQPNCCRATQEVGGGEKRSGASQEHSQACWEAQDERRSAQEDRRCCPQAVGGCEEGWWEEGEGRGESFLKYRARTKPALKGGGCGVAIRGLRSARQHTCVQV